MVVRASQDVQWTIMLDSLSGIAIYILHHLHSSQGVSLHGILFRVMMWGMLGYLAWFLTKWKWQNLGQKELKKSVGAGFLLCLNSFALLFALSILPTARVVMVNNTSSFVANLLLTVPTHSNVLTYGLGLLLSLSIDVASTGTSTHLACAGYLALLVSAVSSVFLHRVIYSCPAPSKPMVSLVAIMCGFVFSLVFHVTQTGHPTGIPESFWIPLTPLLVFPFVGAGISPAKRLGMVCWQSLTAVWVGSAIINLYVYDNSFVTIWKDVPYLVCLAVAASPPVQKRQDHSSATQILLKYLKTILDNPESRKIFYFLLLNLCYMLVQMLYGIWTNSLGLISDAIHMAFDCMAIGIGLIASVMARWPPNEKFTFGYGRIETLSGFSNGIFLILISIFIVFEAVQRLLNPPDMNTSQLLLVSTVGLAVNLFGMFAMGGHHHGGHSHSHSQAHSHQHSHLDQLVLPNLQADHKNDPNSPLTPSYHFEHDAHLEHFHGLTPEVEKSSQSASPEGHSHNMQGIFLHILADTLGSVGVIVSTLLIQFYGWTGFDPIASLFIAILIAASVVHLVVDTAKVLMLDLSNDSISINLAMLKISEISEISQFSVHLWPRNDSITAGSLQLWTEDCSDAKLDSSSHHNINVIANNVLESFEHIEGFEQFNIQLT